MSPEEVLIIRQALMQKLLDLRLNDSNEELQQQIRNLLIKLRINK